MSTPMLTTRSIRIAGALCLASALLVGCHQSPPAAADAAPASGTGAKEAAAGKKATGTKAEAGGKDEASAKDEAGGKEEAGGKDEAGAGVTLTPEQIEKLGVATAAVKSIDYREETGGYGVVVVHETIAQAAAEIVTAQATERLSQ